MNNSSGGGDLKSISNTTGRDTSEHDLTAHYSNTYQLPPASTGKYTLPPYHSQKASSGYNKTQSDRFPKASALGKAPSIT